MLQQHFIKNIKNLLGQNIPDHLAIAVSGGVDSIALLYLTIEWVKNQRSFDNCQMNITVFSVDHNLRSESKFEIAHVAKLASDLGVNFVPFSWDSGHQNTAIQERAREGRYSIIIDNCKKLGITTLLTAHHLDDMLETYLIKKSKKTSNMAQKPNVTYFRDNIWILRPLFDIHKQELIDYLVQNQIKWFEDASNYSDKYERNRVRQKIRALSVLEKLSLIDEYKASIIKANQLNDVFIKILAESVCIYNEGFAKLLWHNIISHELLYYVASSADDVHEMQIHILNYIITIIGGKKIVPRYRNIERIIAAINNGSFKTSTLGGCKLVSKNGWLVVFKEKFLSSDLNVGSRIDNPNIDMSFKSSDNNRFYVAHVPINCYVGNLTIDEYIKIKKQLNLSKLAKDSENNHKSILFTLPVIKNLEKVVAIPHISYYDDCDNLLFDGHYIKPIFKPNFISRFTHFF